MSRYRIVTDNYLGYEVQKRFLFFFWIECSYIYTNVNTFKSIEQCEKFIESLIDKTHKRKFKSRVIKNIIK